jgi:hypothetical protein
MAMTGATRIEGRRIELAVGRVDAIISHLLALLRG